MSEVKYEDYKQELDYIDDKKERIEDVIDMHLETFVELVKKFGPSCVKLVTKPSLDICFYAVTKEPSLFRSLPDNMKRNLQVQIATLGKEGIGLQYIAKSYLLPEVAEYAIQLDWRNLQYVKNPTDELIYKAYRQNARALMYVLELSDNIKTQCIYENPTSIKWIKNQELDDQMFAVGVNPNVLRHIHNPLDQDVVIAAVFNPDFYSLENVSEQYRTFPVCVHCVARKRDDIAYVPVALQQMVVTLVDNGAIDVTVDGTIYYKEEV